MKTRSSGWKTRLQVLGLAALGCVALGSGFSDMAQDTAAAPAEAVAAETVPAPIDATVAAPAEAVVLEAPAAAPAEAAPAEPEAAPAPTISKADTVWVLVSAALVIFMTLPGLALFYGGLVRSKDVLSIVVQNVVVFKRGVYSRALQHLAPLARDIAGAQAVPQPNRDVRSFSAKRPRRRGPPGCGYRGGGSGQSGEGGSER